MKSKLILIRGPICSGKSTIVRDLRDKLDQASLADFDVIKQQIDCRASSAWRREIALRTAVYLAGELLAANRTVIAEIHSAFPEEYRAFEQVAAAHNSFFFSFLVNAPLEVCLERKRNRPLFDAWYTARDAELIEHWTKTYHIPGEPEFDTSREKGKEIVAAILQHCKTAEETDSPTSSLATAHP